ncbi:UDP-N-acetylmuramoyl-L-alanyl-D-glutamate--2,6-diaminopimelate ligase [Demequina zhanjiangensis]|uniref:UDP-N-acetylmuramyl-tripeptide synthetase n=1 Tax=Demequina zhanjiangensis TaxID=3051659 RepID=A0ABT8G3E9_9MICO|nr:UDP-N-acetylmuramoyl-L-alanyl-D-glutamate--2,6-diaminopimelate ligase [Demequina sp. SYSU T00b26]MDN4473666.1 UDP-N-acetylmuramoyl-L-alanyl-D-glutamate--2,6-diaminopimelate ligase [Demequina sp. SYSU T00b26]
MELRPAHAEPVSVARVAARLGVDVPADVAALQVTGATVDSREVRAGDLFGAFPGFKVHGARFGAQVSGSGAVAVLTDAEGAEILRTDGVDLPVIVVDDARAAMGEAAALIYGDPSKDMAFVGVTGTNGKTTTSYFIESALKRVHARTGIMGTVELRIGDEAIESPRTTVESPVLHGLLARMREEGVTSAVTEVSSHAAALDRIAGVEFSVAVFTNLQWDHLDFHKTMDGYLDAKGRLFEPGRARRGVINVDDEWGRKLAARVEIPCERVSTRPEAPQEAEWIVTWADVGLDGVGSRFTFTDPQGVQHHAESPLPGLVNVSNAMVAIVAAHAAGVPLAEAIAGVAGGHEVPGRMERVIERSDVDPLAIVDYAHTPDALTLALEGVRPITPGRLILIFGSDGDRDQGKRPVMGEIAATLADVIVLTDENPRSEEPAAIRAAIREGIQKVRPELHDVHEVEPRVAAVEYGLRLGRPGDTVIVTGKGHEPTQEIAGVFHRYNDRDAYLAAHARIVAERKAEQQ